MSARVATASGILRSALKRRSSSAAAASMSTSTSGAPSVAVVGGGISGLVCATDLAAHGFQVSVFDMGKINPGGRLGRPGWRRALPMPPAGCSSG